MSTADTYRRGQTVYVTDPLCGTGRLEATVMLDRGDGYVTVWLDVQQRALTVPAKRLAVPAGAR
jgi:hypothetical protein